MLRPKEHVEVQDFSFNEVTTMSDSECVEDFTSKWKSQRKMLALKKTKCWMGAFTALKKPIFSEYFIEMSSLRVASSEDWCNLSVGARCENSITFSLGEKCTIAKSPRSIDVMGDKTAHRALRTFSLCFAFLTWSH